MSGPWDVGPGHGAIFSQETSVFFHALALVRVMVRAKMWAKSSIKMPKYGRMQIRCRLSEPRSQGALPMS